MNKIELFQFYLTCFHCVFKLDCNEIYRFHHSAKKKTRNRWIHARAAKRLPGPSGPYGGANRIMKILYRVPILNFLWAGAAGKIPACPLRRIFFVVWVSWIFQKRWFRSFILWKYFLISFSKVWRKGFLFLFPVLSIILWKHFLFSKVICGNIFIHIVWRVLQLIFPTWHIMQQLRK